MRNTALALVVITLLLGASSASANAEHNRYKWKDAQGNLHFDDVLPSEAMDVGYDIVNTQGLTIKHIPRIKTAAEQKAEEEAAARTAVERQAAEDQAKADQQTLAAYPTEFELVDTQKAQIAMLDQNIHATELSLQSQEKSLTEMLSHAADLERTGKVVPATLQSQIDVLRKNIESQKLYIAGKQKEKVDAGSRFEVELKHYRELHERSQSH
jgi:predicted DNA-binding protein YlxM (UPF0122 family)